MRKNYFAKKFVAYSMAFAVAFSTLTVSPVFVKEAKAAANIIDVKTDANNQFEAIEAGGVIVGPIATTLNNTGEDKVVSSFKAWAGFNSEKIVGKIASNNDITVGTGTSPTPVAFSTAGQSKGVAFNGLTRNENSSASKAENVGNKVLEIEAKSATANDACVWYKLVKAEREVNYTVGANVEKVIIPYYVLEAVSAEKIVRGSDTTKDKLKFAEVTVSDLGIYISVASNTVKDIIEVKEASDMDVDVNQKVVKTVLGGKVLLGVDGTCTKPLTYKWSKNGKELGTEATLSLSNLTEADFGVYSCKVSDGLLTQTLSVDVQKAKVTDASATNATTISTVANILNTDNNLKANEVTLKTSIPENPNYVYIWNDANGIVDNLSAATMANYNASNRTLSISKKSTGVSPALIDYASNTIDVYAVLKADYERVLEEKLDDVNKAASYDKIDYVKALLTQEKTEIVKSGASITLPVQYKETITFQQDTVKDVSEVITPNLGDALQLTVPSTISNDITTSTKYRWKKGSDPIVGATTSSYKLNTLGISDYATYTCEIDLDGGSSFAADINYIVNVKYISDFNASATNVIKAKVDAKDVVFSVNATSSLPLEYTWTPNSLASTLKENAKLATDKTISAVTIPKVQARDFGGLTTTGLVDTAKPYVKCVVTDGIATQTFQFIVDKVVGYKVAESGTQNVAARKDTQVTLKPTVELVDSESVTYEWKKVGTSDVVSTDASYTFDFDGTTVGYEVTITDGVTNTKVEYNVEELSSSLTLTNKTLFKVVAKDIIYDGKAHTDNIIVTYTDSSNKFTLVENKDYVVEAKENVNVGIARYVVSFIGDFKDYEDATNHTKTFEGQFYIDRADNKLEIADKTVTLGQSVQPATVTNLSKGALTYTYYADADCTTEIDVPNKVGTYYVKATSVATANYNEATSNVATIKITGLGKTKIGSTSRTASSVKLPWTKVEGATKYRVYKKAAGASSYTKVADTTALSYNVT